LKFSNQEIPQLTRVPPFYKAHHREWAVTGRIFQALPTQTDTMFALIYKMAMDFCLLSILIDVQYTMSHFGNF